MDTAGNSYFSNIFVHTFQKLLSLDAFRSDSRYFYRMNFKLKTIVKIVILNKIFTILQ